MSVWVWVLTYTILGSQPQHGTISKYSTQNECEASLAAMKSEQRARGLQLVGTCRQVLKAEPRNK